MKTYYEIAHIHDKKQKMIIPVEIISYRNCYGRKICKIRPVHGEGEMNVNDESLIVKK